MSNIKEFSFEFVQEEAMELKSFQPTEVDIKRKPLIKNQYDSKRNEPQLIGDYSVNPKTPEQKQKN
jgi:hypothetical protein